ncbi:MAG: hypothetical protein IJ568_06010 [Bacilli bacterium]|nr:hypothetical protein [Bacilli bacterium]
MASNRLVIREEEIEDLSATMNKVSNNTSSASKGVVTRFGKAASAGMGPSVKAISKELSLISQSIDNVKNIMRKHTKELFDYDLKMAQEAGAIEIPQDFLANNSTKVNTYNRSLLSKIDGRSVNEGVASHAFEEIADNTINRKDVLDITKDATKEQTYDASSQVVRSAVSDITSDKEQQLQNLDEKTVIGQSVLTNINNNNVQRTQQLDESTVIGKSVLSDISNGIVPGEVKLDDDTEIEGQLDLDSINNRMTSTEKK